MNELSVFENAEFGKVRIIEENGKPLFCGSDVAKALGYTRPNDAISAHCRSTVKHRIPHPQSPDKKIEMVFIPEGDVYRLITHSKLSSAERFEKWVFDEVLPSIRKHGAYVTEATMDNIINDPDFGIRLLQELKTEREQRTKFEQKTLLLEQENKVLEAEAEVLRPKASYYDLILQSPDAMPITEIAKDYGMSACKLNRILSDLRVQYRIRDTWVLFGAYHDKGYTKLSTYITPSGAVRNHTCWTQKGREFLYTLLKANGILPMIEQK